MLRTSDLTGGGGGRLSSQLTFLHTVSSKTFAKAIKRHTLYDGNFFAFFILCGMQSFAVHGYFCLMLSRVETRPPRHMAQWDAPGHKNYRTRGPSPDTLLRHEMPRDVLSRKGTPRDAFSRVETPPHVMRDGTPPDIPSRAETAPGHTIARWGVLCREGMPPNMVLHAGTAPDVIWRDKTSRGV